MKKDKDWLKIEVINKITSYLGSTSKRSELINLIDQLDEPEKVVVSKMEKVVIPQFVADWIKECKKHGKSLSECLVTFNFNHEKAFNWTNAIRLDREEIVARAWLDGYSVEKEKLYHVQLPNGTFLIQSNVDINGHHHWFNKNFTMYDNAKVQFTEQEIKAIDERYWAFAEEVTE